MTYHIFVGFDERQSAPFNVAKHTLEKYSSGKIKVHKLHHQKVRSSGLFTREWTISKSGQYLDNVDHKPFSTQFSHTRFLVPELWRSLPDDDKSPLVMFVDCDYLWVEDIMEMFDKIENKKLLDDKKALYCVKHDYAPSSTKKMDNMTQVNYNMKLWSAMMVFDMDHPDNALLTPDVVNSQDGRWLHNFGWIGEHSRIGDIDESWHYIPNHSEKNTKIVKAIHYTEGGPWFENYRTCRYADLWWKEYNSFLTSTVSSVSFDKIKMLEGE